MQMSQVNLDSLAANIPQQMNFAEMCKSLRTQLGLTQQKMADLLKVDMRHYQKWEYGTHEPSALAVAKLLAIRDQLAKVDNPTNS